MDQSQSCESSEVHFDRDIISAAVEVFRCKNCKRAESNPWQKVYAKAQYYVFSQVIFNVVRYYMTTFLLIKWNIWCMKCQFPYGIFKFLKDFLHHLEYYDMYSGPVYMTPAGRYNPSVEIPLLFAVQ